MPAELRTALDAAIDGTAPGAGSLADRLADAGLAALLRSIEAGAGSASDRRIATDLLVADALLTYACEAAAEAGPDALDRLTGSLDLRRFSALLQPSAP